MSNRAKLNGWRSNRSSAHASASGHLVLWNKRLLMASQRRHNGGSREKAARRPGERPCRSDAWRSCAGSGELAPEVVTQGYCENQVAEGPFSVGKSRFLPSVAFVQRVRRSRIVLVRSGCKTPQSGYSLGRL